MIFTEVVYHLLGETGSSRVCAMVSKLKSLMPSSVRIGHLPFTWARLPPLSRWVRVPREEREWARDEHGKSAGGAGVHFPKHRLVIEPTIYSITPNLLREPRMNSTNQRTANGIHSDILIGDFGLPFKTSHWFKKCSTVSRTKIVLPIALWPKFLECLGKYWTTRATSPVHGRVMQWSQQGVQQEPVDTESSALTNRSHQLSKIL